MTQISFAPFCNFNSAVPWGLWVTMYVWLVGISVGSFVLVMWGNIKGSENLKALTKPATLLSISALLAGLLSIQIDLGHIERFPKLFLSPNFNSVMAWMAWLYTGYVAVLLVSLRWQKKEMPKLFCGFSVIFAMVALIAESLLFALPPGKIWHSLFFPLHFITSSFVSGIAALIILTAILKVRQARDQLLKSLGKIALPFVILNTFVEIIELATHKSLFHPAGLILLLANIIIIALLLKCKTGGIIKVGYLGLIQVLFSKYHSIISAQVIEPYKGFALAYIEPRLNYSYAPSLFEIFVTVGLLVMVLVVFYFLYKIFPLTKEA
ncbi:MAG: NrfD/PsrC family molybdoenzyme membrane anchor subunit [Candidatus Omnitrophota bacterium]